MSSTRHLLSCASLCLLGALAGCQAFSSDYWQSPSILTHAPPEPEKREKHENQGGFGVMVEAPGQPAAARVIADVGAFAQRRGFVHVGASPGGERYVSGPIVLDVGFRSSDSHVVAALHGAHLARKVAETFYHDFDREYARQYGEVDPIIESDFLSD